MPIYAVSRSRFSAKKIAFCALFAALSIVFGKLLQIPVGNSIRLSFENLPLLLASLWFGPVVGAFSAVTADLLGCLIVGFAINPIITLGALLVGVLPALLIRLLPRFRPFVRTLCAVIGTHLIASVFVKSLGLFVYYQTPFPVLLLRLPVYLLIGTLESILITYLWRVKPLRALVLEAKR